MQTFLPYPDFNDSAKVLDRLRLGKQRVEAMQILRTNLGQSEGWSRHPATLMWRGHDQALASYLVAVCDEWTSRGYVDSCGSWVSTFLDSCPDWDDAMLPPWLGSEAFHASHRASLLAKDTKHYGQFGWSEAPKIEYIWPTKEPAYV